MATRLTAFLFVLLFSGSVTAQHAAISFKVTADPAVLKEPFTGRVYVTLTNSQPQPVTRNLNWFKPEPTFALDVKAMTATAGVTLGANALAFPIALKDLPKGKYYAQAILDRDLGGISVFSSPGNLYSKAKRFTWDGSMANTIELQLDQVVDDDEFTETGTVKYFEITSKLLSDFHKKPIKLRAGVVLPKSYAKEATHKYPTVYEIPGFGGDHHHAGIASITGSTNVGDTEAIWVVLDPNCRLGHHVFADSANNGPYGRALVEELIPALEKKFRMSATPGTRLLTGHSSGGWSSLWLQITHPEFFGGCWSTSPDPVDFRDFQRVDLTAKSANLFKDEAGNLRDLSRGDRGKTLQFQKFAAMEDCLGRGGQLASFEAVFSPRMPDGTPRKLYDRKSGAIDPVTAKAWEAFDVRKILENDWAVLGPKLKGKVHLWMGDVDTFYLDGAARLLKESQAKLKSDAVIELFPRKTHALLDRELKQRMNREMAAAVTAPSKP
ncbi:alpha/beta hydrolase-fold protein [soil metagenome]